jgi:hypothetical protein
MTLADLPLQIRRSKGGLPIMPQAFLGYPKLQSSLFEFGGTNALVRDKPGLINQSGARLSALLSGVPIAFDSPEPSLMQAQTAEFPNQLKIITQFKLRPIDSSAVITELLVKVFIRRKIPKKNPIDWRMKYFCKAGFAMPRKNNHALEVDRNELRCATIREA